MQEPSGAQPTFPGGMFLSDAPLEPMNDLAVQAPARATSSVNELLPQLVGHAQEESVPLPSQAAQL
jgi:hypothetical protein